MTIRLKKFWLAAMVVETLAITSGTVEAQTLSLKPVSSTGPYVAAGDEIYITPGGATVDFEIIIADWSDAPGSPNLGALYATIEAPGYLGANATPPNPGVDLLPLGYALPNPNGGNRALGHFQVTNLCSISGRDCTPGQPSCIPGEGTCNPNPRFVVSECVPFSADTVTSGLDYYSEAVCATQTGVIDHHDPNRGYVSTLRLVVPPAAAGRYEVALINNFNFASVYDNLGLLILGFTFQTAKINISSTLPPDPALNVRKNRYVSFAPTAAGSVAYRLELMSSTMNPAAAGFIGWVGAPSVTPKMGTVSQVVDAPVFRVWDDFAVHIGDCEIMPGCVYELRSTADGTTFSSPMLIATAGKPLNKDWCDMVGSFNGTTWPPPDGFANVNDILAVLSAASGKPTAPLAVRANLQVVSTVDSCLNYMVNVGDVFMAVLAVSGQTYPFERNPAACLPCP